jgi:hypothetical protein
MIKQIIYITILIAVFSCSKDSACSKPKGKIISIEKNLSNFTGIETLENINIEWVKSTEFKAIITTGENLIEQIDLSIKDNILTIENQNTCSWLRDDIDEVFVKVYAPSPSLLIHRGNGNLSSKDTITTNIRIENYYNQSSINLTISNDSTWALAETGSLDLTLQGNTNYFYLYNVGYNYVFAKNFISKNCHINNNSWVTNQVTVTKKLIIENFTSGEIQYWGNPNSVEVTINQSNGKIIKMD